MVFAQMVSIDAGAAAGLDVEPAEEPAATSPMGGALRIYARDADSRVRLIADGAAVKDATRLVDITFYPNGAVAQAIATYCGDLLTRSGMPAGRGGWHPFPVMHLKTLLANARTHLNVTIIPDGPEPGRRPWTAERVARLGFLAGQGWTAKAIAEDPLIRSTAGNVQRQANKLGIMLSEIPQGQVMLRLPHMTTSMIDRFAISSQMTRDAFLRRWIIRSVADPHRFGLMGAA